MSDKHFKFDFDVATAALKEMVHDTGLRIMALNDKQSICVDANRDGYALRFYAYHPIQTFIPHEDMLSQQDVALTLRRAVGDARKTMAAELRALADRMDPK